MWFHQFCEIHCHRQEHGEKSTKMVNMVAYWKVLSATHQPTIATGETGKILLAGITTRQGRRLPGQTRQLGQGSADRLATLPDPSIMPAGTRATQEPARPL